MRRFCYFLHPPADRWIDRAAGGLERKNEGQMSLRRGGEKREISEAGQERRGGFAE